MRLISIISANASCDPTHIDSSALIGGDSCGSDKNTSFSISCMTASSENTVPTSRECQGAIQMVGSGQVMDALETDAKIRAFFPMLRLIASIQAPNTRRAGRVALLAELSSMVSGSSHHRRSKYG
jgi:hypothetical protein